MKTIDSIQLSSNELAALIEIRRRINNIFTIRSYILFGSVVRGEREEGSDIDLLIVTSEKIGRAESHRITDIVFEINLQYNTNYSVVVVDEKTWEEGIFSILPIKEDIKRDGVLV